MKRAEDQNFINNVKMLLSKKGMQQKELADLMGCTRQHLNAVMRGRNNLSKEFENRIAKALEVTVRSLHEKNFNVTKPSPEQSQVAQVNVPLLVLLIKGSGGRVSVSEVSSSLSFKRDWLYQKGDPDQIGAMVVHGGAMKGEIPDGATVLIDQSQTELVNGSVFLVGYKGKPYFVRVFQEDDGTVKDLSGQIEAIEPFYLQVLGRCVWYGKDLI